MTTTRFIILGEPVPQGRPRAFRLGNGVRMYDPPKSAAWKRDIKAQLRREKNHKVREGALSVALEFYLSRPKSLPKSATRHIKRPDVDNLAKAVLDAMRGEVYRDDAQIEQLRVSKRYSESTGVTIDIEELT